MSRNQRLALIAAAIAVAVVAFVIAQPGGDDDGDETDTRSAQTTTAPGTETNPVATAPAPEPKPAVHRIRLQDGAVVGGPKTIQAESGETVRIVVTSNAPDELHLHGFDITRNAEPGRPARFNFKAEIEGSFELESHTAEHAGREPLVARVEVGPS
jgi:FtsP/CotA-like multicopper oxidase with cupredoxin domain